MEIKYSVLTSVYYKENPEYFKVCLDSMLNQTYKPDEIVIVKDGKLTEQLEKIIDEFVLGNNELFTVVEIGKNVGLGLALDEGLKYCRNELIARIDTDDISLPERCETQIKAFSDNTKLSIVGTMVDEFYDDPNNIIVSRIVPTNHEEIVKYIRRRSPFNHTTVMYKKSDVIRCGGYGSLRRKQDLDLFSRMINGGCRAENINKSLVLFRSNEDSFKRRKSWTYCKSYIEVEYAIWERGHCSFLDILIVIAAQMFIFLSPMFLFKWMSNTFLRKRHNE